MTTFYSRRESVGGTRRTAPAPRVGLVFLNTVKRRLYCLNDTARQFIADGVPMNAGDLTKHALLHLSGEPVTGEDLPLLKSWRENAALECSFLLPRPSGPAQLVHWTTAPLCDAGDAVVGVTGSVTLAPPEPDWQVLAGLAHDLRTPLQALRLLVPLLQETELTSEAHDLASRIRSAADRGMSVGLDLLEWCRGPTQAGRRVQQVWFPLGPFLTSLVGEQRAAAQEKDIRLHTEIGATNDYDIMTDQVRFGRLLANLLSNAIRYTTAGRVQFTATWRTHDNDEAPSLVLKVVDTGVGMTAEEQESIFLPYERGRAGKEGDSGGSGVGLSVVDRLVEELGLTLEVFSEYGHGSSFEVLLPATLLRRRADSTSTDG